MRLIEWKWRCEREGDDGTERKAEREDEGRSRRRRERSKAVAAAISDWKKWNKGFGIGRWRNAWMGGFGFKLGFRVLCWRKKWWSWEVEMKVSYSYSYSILFSKESICSSRRTKVFLLQQPKKMYTQYISELLFIILNKKNTLDKSILLLLLSYHFYLFFSIYFFILFLYFFYIFFPSIPLIFIFIKTFISMTLS